MNNELIQLLDIIIYRLQRSTQSADEKYFDFKAGNNSRSPSEILLHLVDVSSYGLSIAGIPKSTDSENDVMKKTKENFMRMKSHLSKNKMNEDTSKKLINGPLSDTLTHIGQLALLRRLEGNPIEWENYTNAET